MKILFNSILLLCFLSLSCISKKSNETTNKKLIIALEPNVILTRIGETGEGKIYTNPYLIAGIVPKNNKPNLELFKILEELELEFYQPISSNRLPSDTLIGITLQIDIGSTQVFTLIKKKNSEPFNPKYSHELGILRQKFRRFGPICFNSQRQIQGVFDHKIDVLASSMVKRLRIDSIAKNYSAEVGTFSYVGNSILYSVKFPKNTGNEIVKIAKKISKIKMIISATPIINVIINGNP